MSYNIRKISNGVLVGGPVGKDGNYEESAFLEDDPKWEEKATSFININSDKIAESMVKQAKDQLKNVKEELKNSKTQK